MKCEHHIENTKPYLHNTNAHIKLGDNSLIFTQASVNDNKWRNRSIQNPAQTITMYEYVPSFEKKYHYHLLKFL